MGAYVYYKVANESNETALKANEILERNTFNKTLCGIDCGFFINDQSDVKHALDDGDEHLANYFKKRIGTSDYKVSAIDEDLEKIDMNHDDFFEQVTCMFEELNAHIDMRYLMNSCAFGSSYFTDQQVLRLTQNGKLFSGEPNPRLLKRLKLD